MPTPNFVGRKRIMAWPRQPVRGTKKKLSRKFSISFRLLLTDWLHRQGILAARAKVFGTAYALRLMHRDARS